MVLVIRLSWSSLPDPGQSGAVGCVLLLRTFLGRDQHEEVDVP